MWWGAVVVQGIDFNGGSLRIATPRGGGGTVDTVMYEDIRGHNMNYLLEFNMWCGARDAATQLHSLTRYLSSCLVHLLSSRCTPPGAGTSARPRLGGRSRHRATCPPTPHPHPRCRTSSYATCRFDSLSPPLCLPRRLPHCVSINRLSHCVSLTVSPTVSTSPSPALCLHQSSLLLCRPRVFLAAGHGRVQRRRHRRGFAGVALPAGDAGEHPRGHRPAVGVQTNAAHVRLGGRRVRPLF